MMLRREFIVHQHYEVTVEQPIHPLNGFKSDRQDQLFRAIVTSEEALNAVLEYKVVCEHDMLGDGCGLFVKEHYGKDIGFFDILLRQADRFTPEDKAWLLRMKKDYEEARAEYERTGDDENTFDLSVQVEKLEDCFKAEPCGYCLLEIGKKTPT